MPHSLVRWLAAALVLAAAAGWSVVLLAPDDPARWHADPAAIALRVTPNEVLLAAAGTTSAAPHGVIAIRPGSPEALLARFDSVARLQPRVTVLAGTVAEGMITYVQRSRWMRFPDYITVKAVPAEGGAGLIVWSRSRYGYGDFGVNRARVQAWLAAMDDG